MGKNKGIKSNQRNVKYYRSLDENVFVVSRQANFIWLVRFFEVGFDKCTKTK